MEILTEDTIIETNITIVGTKREINKIRNVFNELKTLLNVNKRYLYTKLLLWIIKSKKARAEFIKYIQDEKEKILKNFSQQYLE